MLGWIYPGFGTGRGGVGLLALRLVAGIAFVFHGWPKIQNPLGWMGDAAPGPLQALAAVAEFGGGIALILGLLTPLFAFLLACTMAYAVFVVHVPAGHAFVAGAPGQPSFELAAVYLAIMILMLLVGPGKLSVDALLFCGRAATTES
jgi:putative oxidoreductase